LNFQKLLQEGVIELFIVAGCLKEDMIVNGYNKSMQQFGTDYRVVKIVKGFDASGFYEVLSKIIE